MSNAFRQLSDRDELDEVSMLIAGTGGLGVVGLTGLMADCLGARFQCVHTEETRGIAQRRAPVRSILRAGRSIRSARLHDDTVDVVLAVEAAEALRAAPHVTANTVCVVADLMAHVSGAMSAAVSCLSAQHVAEMLEARGARVLIVPVARWLRSERLPEVLSSTAVYGAASALFGSSLNEAAARLARRHGPRMSMQNCEALRIGYTAAQVMNPQAEAPAVTRPERKARSEWVVA